MFSLLFLSDSLVVCVPDDPVPELRYPGVDAGAVAVAATDAPADHASQLVSERLGEGCSWHWTLFYVTLSLQDKS